MFWDSSAIVPYLIAEDATEEQLYLSEPPGVRILTNQEVVNVDPERRRVETAPGDFFEYDRLLIATGGAPEKLKAQLPGCAFFYCY